MNRQFLDKISHTTFGEELKKIGELSSLGIPKGYTGIKNVFAR